MIPVNVMGAFILRSRSNQTSSGVLMCFTGLAADTAMLRGSLFDRFLARSLIFTSLDWDTLGIGFPGTDRTIFPKSGI